MSLQTYFKEFNKAIKMDYDVKSELKEKRDILLGILRNDDDMPAFDEYNQGSYSMHLGVEPLDKEYDIDVGLRFHVNRDDYEPMDLKEKIRDLLKNHTEYGTKIKKPCVTVTYKKDGEAAYHVDLVTYVYEDKDDSDSQLYLARGKNRDSEETCWEKSDPVGLVEYVNDKYKGDDNKEDREQFRRVVRYIKRWKNKKFSSSGNAEPPSIAITLIAVDHFEASKKYDYIEEKYCYDDLQAVISFAKEIQNLFVFKEVNENGRLMYTIEYNLSSLLNFESDVNLFRKMSDNYMTDFKEKIDNLVNDLEAVKSETDEVEQCKMLSKIFGDDFPIPEKKAILIGGGIGIPPMLELAKSIKAAGTCEFVSVMGYRDAQTFLLDEFKEQGDCYVATEDGSVGAKGNVLDAMKEYKLNADVIYACGPTPMLRALKAYAAEQGMTCYISMEERMACGIGACLACVCNSKEKDAHSNVKNKRICKEGPVFLAEEVDL